MRVKKRNGDFENVSFDKVLKRMQMLSSKLNVDIYEISQKVCTRIYDGVCTSELDEFAAHICSSMIIEHPDYGVLASRIAVSNHHKATSPSFSETIHILYSNVDERGDTNPLVSKDLYEIVMKNKEKLNVYIDYKRDYEFDFFGFKTLERSYLMRVDGKIIERPQQMFMRVSLGIHGTDFKDALQTYDMMSQKYFTHATPTLYNSGTPRPQNSSCYLLHMNDDSIEGIFSSLHECAQISKYAGGIGIHIHNIRSKGSRIRGTNGKSSGIIPMLRVFNNCARYVDQAGRRPGSIAVYLEPWHGDIESFLDMKKNSGAEEERARDLFYAMWIPDLFMKRVQSNDTWSLMCPDQCPGLSDVYGDEFVSLYETYEKAGKYVKQVKAQDIWFKILESQIETGTPYILYKDAANSKSNQKNLGTIKSSNLCSEIIEYTSPDEISVCNLASICLPTFVKSEDGTPSYDFDKLHEISMIVTKNLNKVIDVNFYPVDKARVSNLKHRPIGIGVQGLADTFTLMRVAFDSPEARQLNRDIFETIYHGAVESSMTIARKRHEIILSKEKHDDYDLHLDYENIYDKFPGAYSSFDGSPASKGLLQFDLWNAESSRRYDWNMLKKDIMQWGLRNSLLLAQMPTATTSQIMGFNESTEPFTSNIYKRKTMSGEFILVNKYLIKDLIHLNLWNKNMKDQIVIAGGSIQNIADIPENIKVLYKTVWEIKQKMLIDQSADRGAFICQSQSLNLWMEDPNYQKLSSMHFYGWKTGIKTGIYYLRTRPKVKAQQVSIDPAILKVSESTVVNTQNEVECEACGA